MRISMRSLSRDFRIFQIPENILVCGERKASRIDTRVRPKAPVKVCRCFQSDQ